jgi:hypothetical protein
MRLLALITIVATATALTLAPAAAKSKKHHRAYHNHYGQVQPGYVGGPHVNGYAGGYGGGWSGGGWSNGGYVNGYAGQYGGGWNGGAYGGGWQGGWNSRAVSDPSIGHPSAGEVSRWNGGRCVEDLGYGRYEACGW